MKKKFYFFIKRTFDLIVVSIIAIPFFAIIYTAVAIAIKIEYVGPGSL